LQQEKKKGERKKKKKKKRGKKKGPQTPFQAVERKGFAQPHPSTLGEKKKQEGEEGRGGGGRM